MTFHFVGVDPSLHNTGITVWSNKGELVYHATIKNPEARVAEVECSPYAKMYEGIATILHEYKPKAVFIEEMFMSPSTLVTKALFWAQFVVMFACHNERVPYYLIKSGTTLGWQHFMLGAEKCKEVRKEVKIHARKFVESAADVSFQNEHVADSASIAFCGAYRHLDVDFFKLFKVPPPPVGGKKEVKKPKGKYAKPDKKPVKKTRAR